VENDDGRYTWGVENDDGRYMWAVEEEEHWDELG